MQTKLILAGLAFAVAAALPSAALAYGAAHVGYTHVGPNGVYHSGETVGRGPEGNAYAVGHTGASTTGAYGVHTTAGATNVYHAPTANVAPTYHYAPTYSGSTGVHTSNYNYIR